MKFGYFSHVWGREGITPAQRYDELWREIALADDVGFDYAFSVEHHFSPAESWMPSPAMFCAGAAQHTSRIRIGPMGYVPALHNPIAIVEEIAALDQVLGGRLEVGVASGVAPSYFGPFGAKFEERKERMTECVDLLRAAYGDNDTIDFTGPFHSYEGVTPTFRPAQLPHPPLWIPTNTRKTLRWLAEIGAHTSSTMIIPRKASEVVYRHYVNWWQEAGHAGVPDIGYWTLVYVGDTDDEAISKAAPHMIHTLTKTLKYGPGAAGASKPGDGSLSTATILEHAGDIDFLLDHNLIFVGSPDTVASRIRKAADEGVFNTVLGEFNFGFLSDAEREDSVRLFADEVMPALRDYEPY